MGWKRTVRSIGAAARSAERSAKRRQRELEAQRKQVAKMQELEQAAYEVEIYENHIDVIQSVHKECSPSLNWKEISESKAPIEPININKHEKEAKLKLETYTPGFIEKIFKREEKMRNKLQINVTNAINKDSSEYRTSLSIWDKEISDWKESVELARNLLKGDKHAKIKVIEELNPFSEISTLGSNVSFSVSANGIIEAEIHIHGNNIVPSEVKNLLKSGRLSVKNMPKGKFNEMYQDYVCSCLLRVANELFSIIPDNIVIVTAMDDLLNTSTGHMKKSPILSAGVSRLTLQTLNMENIDPSESMNNFIHNMSFKKNKGFEAVTPVMPESINNY